MHGFLRAVGFSESLSRENTKRLLLNVMQDADERYASAGNGERVRFEYVKYFGERIGICVRGTVEANEKGEEEMYLDYHFPILKAQADSSSEEMTFIRYAEKECLAGVCDDYRLGSPLVFYLQNMHDYEGGKNLSLAALSLDGTVMMPIEKNPSDEARIKKRRENRESLIRRAKQGDEKAIENMTIEDMDIYSVVRRRSQSEDVYSLVESFFMPVGIESDHYSILGEIKDLTKTENTLTGEEVYIMGIIANDLYFDVCINKEDLIGEPEVGRRFKGRIWMQGHVNP